MKKEIQDIKQKIIIQDITQVIAITIMLNLKHILKPNNHNQEDMKIQAIVFIIREMDHLFIQAIMQQEVEQITVIQITIDKLLNIYKSL
jgi:hypothetical protein